MKESALTWNATCAFTGKAGTKKKENQNTRTNCQRFHDGASGFRACHDNRNSILPAVFYFLNTAKSVGPNN